MSVPPMRRAGIVLLLALLVASASAWGGTRRAKKDILRGDALRTGEIVSRKGNAQAGAHPSEILSIRRGRVERQGLFKPALGEKRTLLGVLGHIRPGTHVVREVATFDLAYQLHATFVPPTVGREIEGRHGSVQMMVKAQRAADAYRPGRQLVRRDAERMRVFDYLIGNSDRTVRNLMVRARHRGDIPVAIDNGNAFPRGAIPHFQWPTDWIVSHKGPLRADTLQWLREIDPIMVADVLAGAGIEREATVHVLRRLERLKRDPSFLEVPKGGRRAVAIQMYVRATLAGRSRTQGLRRSQRAAIDDIVARAYAAVDPEPVMALQPAH